MNILFLANHLNIGGISSYILTLDRGLKKRGHNCIVASGGGELLPCLNNEGISHILVPTKTKAEISLNVLISFFKLLPEIKKKNIEIIHANTRVTQVLSCLLSRYSGRPFISTCHGFFKKRLTRRVFPCWGRKVIAISEQVKQHLIDDFHVQVDDIKVIHNGIDTDKFTAYSLQLTAELKQKIGLNDGPVIGIVARLSEVKGHIYLIQSMKTVLERFPDAQLVIVGEGKIKDELARLSRELGIDKNIFFIHNVMDTKGILSIIDVFVLPSLKEGLGLSLMEAMSMGKAVIGSDIGGIKTLIQHGLNGLLVKPADVRQLAEAITELIGDSQKRKILGDNARAIIANNFSQGKMVSETERLYLECLKEKI